MLYEFKIDVNVKLLKILFHLFILRSDTISLPPFLVVEKSFKWKEI